MYSSLGLRSGFASFALWSALCAPTGASASDLSRRLGYADNARILILHADDMGMSDLTNRAVHDVLDYGMVKSASVMIPAPAARAAIEENTSVGHARDLGIHIALNSEWPEWRWTSVSDPHDVPSITTLANGFLHQGREPIFFFGRTADVDREVNAQIERALAWGMQPTHIDTHMGTVLLKKRWSQAYLKAAKRYRIPPMIVRWTTNLKKQLPPIIMDHLKDGVAQAEKAGFLMLDYYQLGIDSPTEMVARKKAYADFFRKLPPGVTMLFMHPSYFAPVAPFPKDVVAERSIDAALMQDPELKQLLADQGIILIGWKEIQAAYDWDKVHLPADW